MGEGRRCHSLCHAVGTVDYDSQTLHNSVTLLRQTALQSGFMLMTRKVVRNTHPHLMIIKCRHILPGVHASPALRVPVDRYDDDTCPAKRLQVKRAFGAFWARLIVHKAAQR